MADKARSIIVEREFPHPPERIWRALTQSHLLEEWMMQNDFEPEPGRSFSFSAEWGKVEGQVLAAEPYTTLSYSWGDHDLDTVVTWTLTPMQNGTRLRMEQTGFREGQPRYYHGAKAGWPRLLAALEGVLERMD
jgi:uncharacterized protein YndB with AHSA1/START domain